jgi:anti-anti-sigma regulatory factor
MDVVVSRENGRVPVTVFRVTGEISIDSYERLQQLAQEAYEAGSRNLLLDLTDVTFVSSSGLRAIHYIFDLLRADGRDESDEAVQRGLREGTFKSAHLKLLNPGSSVRKVLKMSGFDMFLDIHSDLKKALASF